MSAFCDSLPDASAEPFEVVQVPEWKTAVWVRTLSGAERDAFEESFVHDDGDGNRKAVLENVRAKLVQLTACDKDGNLLFAPDDAPALGRKSGKALDRIFAVAKRRAGLTEADVKELAKNSGGAQSAASGSS